MWIFVCRIKFTLDIYHGLDPGLSNLGKLGLNPVAEMAAILILFNKQTAE